MLTFNEIVLKISVCTKGYVKDWKKQMQENESSPLHRSCGGIYRAGLIILPPLGNYNTGVL